MYNESISAILEQLQLIIVTIICSVSLPVSPPPFKVTSSCRGFPRKEEHDLCALSLFSFLHCLILAWLIQHCMLLFLSSDTIYLLDILVNQRDLTCSKKARKITSKKMTSSQNKAEHRI